MRKLQISLILAFNMISCVDLRDLVVGPLKDLQDCIANETEVTFTNDLSGEERIVPYEWLEQIRDAKNPEAILLWHDGEKRNYQLITKPVCGIVVSELSMICLIKRIFENYIPCHEDDESIVLDSSEFGIWEKDAVRMLLSLSLLGTLFDRRRLSCYPDAVFHRRLVSPNVLSALSIKDYESFCTAIVSGELGYILENMGYRKLSDCPDYNLAHFVTLHVQRDDRGYFNPDKVDTYRKRSDFLITLGKIIGRFKENKFTIIIKSFDVNNALSDPNASNEENREKISKYLEEHLSLWTELLP